MNPHTLNLHAWKDHLSLSAVDARAGVMAPSAKVADGSGHLCIVSSAADKERTKPRRMRGRAHRLARAELHL